jgi:hypothetical protein
MKLLALFTLTLLAQQPEGIPFQGTYENKAGYAYRVTVPPGLTGLKTQPPPPPHRVTIPRRSGATTPVDGSYNAQFFPTARHAAEAHAECLANQQITPPNYHPTKLAGLPAIETTIQYRRTKSEPERERRSIIALRPATPEIVYEILLDAPLPASPKNLSAFGALQKSFRLIQ